MIKKNLFIYAFSLLAMSFTFTACEEDDSVDYTKYYKWRDKNIDLSTNLLEDIKVLGQNAYFTDTIVSISEPYTTLYTLSRCLEKANEDSLRKIGKWYTPYYNSTVRVHYTLYDPESVWERFEEYDILKNRSNRNNAEIMNKIFGIGYLPGMSGHEIKADTLESYQVKYFDTTCNGVIKGWADCLQRMHIGDSWLITVPWYLAYGQKGSGSTIDPYTNLYFRIKLVDIPTLGENK